MVLGEVSGRPRSVRKVPVGRQVRERASAEQPVPAVGWRQGRGWLWLPAVRPVWSGLAGLARGRLSELWSPFRAGRAESSRTDRPAQT